VHEACSSLYVAAEPSQSFLIKMGRFICVCVCVCVCVRVPNTNCHWREIPYQVLVFSHYLYTAFLSLLVSLSVSHSLISLSQLLQHALSLIISLSQLLQHELSLVISLSQRHVLLYANASFFKSRVKGERETNVCSLRAHTLEA
jgi:hypothetical protein